MSDTCDAVIVGAGIVGAATAAALAADGLRVTVVESSAVGGGATAAGMGHIVVMDDSGIAPTSCKDSVVILRRQVILRTFLDWNSPARWNRSATKSADGKWATVSLESSAAADRRSTLQFQRIIWRAFLTISIGPKRPSCRRFL